MEVNWDQVTKETLEIIGGLGYIKHSSMSEGGVIQEVYFLNFGKPAENYPAVAVSNKSGTLRMKLSNDIIKGGYFHLNSGDLQYKHPRLIHFIESIKAIADTVQESEWHLLADSLPPLDYVENGYSEYPCLVSTKYRAMEATYKCIDGEYSWRDYFNDIISDVKAWKPLPKKYKGAK